MKQSLLKRLYRSILGDPIRRLLNNSIARWFVVIGAIVYLLSPIDVIPDVPIAGWVDDGFLATVVATELTGILLERRRAIKAQQAEDETDDTGQTTVDTPARSVDDPA
ncbi:MAG: DUF1232 domain-containing protein [Cyanobacteria bacterium J06639_14]